MLREDFRLLAERKTTPLSLAMAHSPAEVREAQALRYQVFSEEMGARLATQEAGIDSDMFDPYCEHLLVRDNVTGAVVGTYRLLNPKMAKRVGGYYSETEFDLTRLSPLNEGMVEVGRSCVHPNYRNGVTIGLLWSGVTQYMQQHGYNYLIGCASIGMKDGGHAAASIYRRLSQEHLSPREWRVFPHTRLPMESLDNTLNAPLPPLVKGYMRLGCFVCGEPAWDPDFNTADLLLLLPLSRMTKRFAKHYRNQT